MIRLINNKSFKFNDDMKYIKLDRQKHQDHSDLSELAITDNDCMSFLNKIESDINKKISAEYRIICNYSDKIFYVLKYIEGCRYMKVISVYKPESDRIFTILEKILRMDSEHNERSVFSGISNNFTFICNIDVLKLIFKKYMLLEKSEKPFYKFKLQCKNGKIRDIVAPHEEIKSTLRDLNTLLQKVYDLRNKDFQVAYKKGLSIKDGALIHKNHNYVFNIDLKDFFPSCKKELVKKFTDFLFIDSFNRKFIENEFFDIILMDDGLFVGSPISGTIANAIISKTVLYLRNICMKYNISLSVYADDISFSSDKFLSKKFVLSLVNEAFSKYNLDQYFKVNEKKCVGSSSNRRKITGVSINNNNDITVSRNYYRNLRVMLDHLSKGKSNVNISILRGKIAYATMIDDSGKILRYLKKFEPTVRKYNLYSGKL